MAEPKWTGGDWTLDDDRVIRCGEATIADVLDTSEGLEGDCDEAWHNGRLMVTSPKLYDALANILGDSGLRVGWRPGETEFVRQLLAEARGES